MKVRARDELAKLGYSKAEAASAVEAVCSHTGASLSLDLVMREALKRLPKR
jgi:Holliday junction resolvasome RuvABC DNA-binding subunit